MKTKTKQSPKAKQPNSLRLEWIEAGSLTPNPMNWRRHPPEQTAALKEMIGDVQIGWAGALLYNERTKRLIDGHARREVVPPETPVPVLVGNWSEEAEQKILATLDPLASMAIPDVAALSELLELVDFDSESLQALEQTLHEQITEARRAMANDVETVQDDVPEPPPEPVTKIRDLIIMGAHRLLCGDCTKVEDVRRLMNGEKAILFATDPPYLVNYDGTNHPHKWNEPDKNKDWSETYGVNWDDADANPDLFRDFIAVAQAEAILPNAAWYCWHASRRQAMLESEWEKAGAFVHQQIVWAKDRPILTRSWYMWQHEPCFMGWVRPNKPPRMADDYPPSVWNIPTVKIGEKTDHPTSKPIESFAIPMRQHTVPGDLCYEPFAGSGSQVIAAEQLGRRCFAMEISPAYVDVCVSRWEKLTGKLADRIGGGGASA